MLIATDEKLIADTEAAIEKATRERNVAQAAYEKWCGEFEDALDAIHECQDLIRGL